METLTTTTLTTNEAAAAGAVLGGMLGTFAVIGIAITILLIVAMWKLFKKAGEPGWKSLIPIYDVYILYKISGAKAWFWGLFVSEVLVIIESVIASANGGVVTDASGNVTAINDVAFGAIVAFAAIFELICYIVLCVKLSKAFKRGAGTAIGLFFFPNIFTLILAFGSAKYDKKVLKK
ncbi:hypothetical protein IKW75_01100 [Candidatus Saccharibacteria bacterium]|nr:hypothetical protein [Candidatus Saccharibacteria bacterium]